MTIGYDGLPPSYIGKGSPLTPNLGLSLNGMDPIVAENFWLIDVFAAGPFGSVIDVNSMPVSNPNFNNTTPAAPVGNTNVVWQVSGGNISAYVPTSSIPSTKGVLTTDVTAGGPVTFSDAQVAANNVFVFTGSPGAPVTVNFPNTTSGTMFVVNSTATGANINLGTVAHPGTVVLDTDGAAINTAGFPVYVIGSTLINSPALSLFTDGTPNSTQRLLNLLSGNSITLSDDGSGDITIALNGHLPNNTTATANQFFTAYNSTTGNFTTAQPTISDLTNIAGGTVLGNNTTSSSAVIATTAPVLGIPGTSTGTIALASSTASGKFTITAPASASTPTLTLPTTSNVLAGQLAGDNVIYASALQVSSAAGTLTIPTPQNQSANVIFAGPTTGSPASPTFRALVANDIPNSTITPIWNNLQNATGALTLANAGNATTFNQTSAVNWTWANTTAATSGVSQSSPLFNLNGTYWTGAASALDSWTIQNVVANGTNGTSTLTFTHTGTSGATPVSFPTVVYAGNGAVGGPSYSFASSTNTGLYWDSGNIALGWAIQGTEYFALYKDVWVLRSNGVTQWSTSTNVNGSVDLGLSRGAANTLYVGTGSASNAGGSIRFNNATIGGTVVSYAGTATVSQGVPSEIVTVDLTAQSAAIAATNLIASAPRSGMYRISWSATITTVDGVSSVLGGTNGFQVGYTSPTDSVAKLTVPGNSITSSQNTTATADGNAIVIYAKTGTAITYRYDYTSGTPGQMVYELHIKLETL